jgi:predicted NBD/HSP70 family sugar kinase
MIVVPSRMGRLNKRALLGHLHRLGTASRADLAKSLGLSQPTAGKIVDELLELGVFEEVSAPIAAAGSPGRTRSKVGRPARMLRLSRSKAHFLGIQLGIRETSFALLPVGSTGEDAWPIQVETTDSAKDWVRQLQQATTQMAEKNFWGILVSVPGLVDERKNRVLYSANLHWTEKVDLTSLVHQVWNAPVVLVQEEHALALGHQAIDPTGEDFLLVDFGDGVGGAVVMAGKLYAHPLPIGGELGHTPVLGNDRRCGCGAVGCLETLTSSRGLLQSFVAASPKSARSLPALFASVERRGVESWFAETLSATAGVIAGALNMLGLRRVVITGTMNELPPSVLAYLAKAISKGALWARFGEIKVEGAPRRRSAGLVAAGLDRLIVPMAESERNQETLLHVSAVHG